MTDREIKENLGFQDMNSVRPRITELITDHDLLKECGTVTDNLTNRPVRLVRIKDPAENKQPVLF
jgi:hypothetical protein